MSEPTDYAVTSVEDAQGRVLSGVGASVEDLEKTIERHSEPLESEKPTDAAPATQQPVEPKPSRGQKRFSELTSERDKERNAREAVEKERDELRQRLEAAEKARHVAEPANRSQPAIAEPSARSVEPDFEKDYEAKVGDTYSTYAQAIQAFNRDYAKWSQTDFDAQIRRSIEADRASRTQAERETQEIARGRKAYADFDAVLKRAAHLASNDWPMHIVDAIQRLEEPEHLRYQLAKDPALAARLKMLDPVTFGMELGKLLSTAPAVAPLAPTAAAGSSLPPPPFQPVGGGSKTTAPPLDDLVKKAGHDFDKSGYREKRAEQLGRMRRR